MASPGYYGDISKSASDLFSEDFPEKPLKLKTSTKTSSGFELTNTITRETNKLAGTFEQKFKLPYDLSLESSLNTENKVKLDFSLPNRILPGLTIGTTFESDLTTKLNSLKGTLKYSQDLFTVKSVLNYPPPAKGALSVVTGVVVGHKPLGAVAGAEVEYSGGDNSIKSWNAALAFKQTDFQLAGAIKNKSAESLLSVSYFQKLRNVKGEFAAEFSTDINKQHESVKLVLAGAYDVEPGVLRIKAKYDTTGKISASISQKINPQVKIIAGTEFDVKDVTPGKFGLNVTFTD